MAKNADKKTEEQDSLKQRIRQQTVGYITAALGLVAGLAWNDAVKSLIEKVYPADKGGVLAKFWYAMIITLVIVLVSTYLLRLVDKGGGQTKK